MNEFLLNYVEDEKEGGNLTHQRRIWKEEEEKIHHLVTQKRNATTKTTRGNEPTINRNEQMFRAGGYGRGRRGSGINPFFYYYAYRMYQQYQAVPNKPHGTLVVMAVMASYYFEVFPLLNDIIGDISSCLLYTSPSPRDRG